MGKDRREDMRVERAAELAVERSLLSDTDWLAATPIQDVGIDLLAYHAQPFRSCPIQVKGASRGLRVFWQYAQQPTIVAYVLDPLGDEPHIHLLTGAEAWDLPNAYMRRGGKAASHSPDHSYYNWSSRPPLLLEILDPYEASPQRWDMMLSWCASGSARSQRVL